MAGDDARFDSTRWLALAVAAAGLALAGYVELRLTNTAAGDRFGWLVYEAGAWLLLLFVGPLLPIGRAVLVAALVSLGVEAFAFHRVFVAQASGDEAAIYLWKPLAQLAMIAAAWLAGYLGYLHRQRERAHG